MLADKAYTGHANRDYVSGRGVKVTIPERDDQEANRARRGAACGRPRAFDTETYHGRNVVEHCFNKLKNWRGIATPYDETARAYLGGVTVAAALISVRSAVWQHVLAAHSADPDGQQLRAGDQGEKQPGTSLRGRARARRVAPRGSAAPEGGDLIRPPGATVRRRCRRVGADGVPLPAAAT